VNGKFEYVFDPVALHDIAQTYDIARNGTGQSELSDVVHITFFSQETSTLGVPYHAFVRLIIRGNTVNYTK
jgi:hypothetical protein